MQAHIKTNPLPLLLLFISFLFTQSATTQEIWGMTKYGGEYDKGVIFKMDEHASGQDVVFSFETVRSPEGGLTEFIDGLFYGMSGSGGEHDYGVIYKFELASGSFTKVLDFDGEDKGKDGAGRMVHASNGKLYGMTVTGGIYDQGILFEFDPATEQFTKKIDFDGQSKGAEPLGSLIEATDGTLYGTTSMGGMHDGGILFSYDITTNILTKHIDFNGATSGSNPMGSLIKASDDMLYGMTRWGGINGHGVIFRLEPATNLLEVVFEFDGSTTGRNPHADLTEASNGKLYGLTPFGGSYNCGVLFEYDPQSDIFVTKYEFTGGAESGRNSYGSLVEANNGKLYGLVEPELHQGEMLFEFNPLNDIYKLAGYPGSYPREFSMFGKSLTLGSNNKLYFIINANQNDIRNENNLYEFNPAADVYTNHFSFSGIYTGEFPHGSLLQALNGMLYGTTYIGGKYHRGVVFKIDPATYSFSKVLDFDGGTKGAKPNGGVIQASNLKLYGLTREGGAHDKGVLYELDVASETFAKLFDFDGINGEFPDGDLVKAANGKLYGVTSTGGVYNEGVLFEFDPAAGSYNKIIDFEGAVYGKEPLTNALVAASNGSIYGTTLFGGAAGKGVLFEYNPSTGTVAKIIEFGGSVPGEVPTNLAQGTDDKLYAHVRPGFLTRFDPATSSYSIVLDDCYIFNRLTGRLLQAENGKFYGMDCGLIWYRATDFTGGVHEFDIDGGSYTQLMEFSWTNGSNPENTSLIQLKSITPPVAQCSDITLDLDEDGLAVLEPADIDNGSTGDNIQLSVNKTDFDCGDTGENIVTLTVTDANGNSSTCNATVTVADNIAPAVVCRDIEIFLDADGNATLEAADVDDGAYDACGIDAMSLNISSFTCEDLGENTVELMVTDIHGNSSVCEATVTVTDPVAPVISCAANLTAYMVPYENEYVIEGTDLDAVADDNCGIESLAFSVDGANGSGNASMDGYVLTAGIFEIEWTAADKSGNVEVCVTEITIEKRPTSMVVLKNEIDGAQNTFLLEVALMDDILENGIEGKSVVFSADGFTETSVTSQDGVALLNVPLDVFSSGEFSVTALFEEDDNYTGCSSRVEVVTHTDVAAVMNVKVYPNPFAEKLNFEFIAPETTNARIDVLDPAGRLVKTVFNQPVESGLYYRVEYSPQFETGSYLIYRMRLGTFQHNGKVMFRK